MIFSEQLSADIALIEPALEGYLSRETHEGYDRIFEAAKYSAMAGGKRLRPVIVLEFCRLHGGDIKNALPFACALEMIHTYSLIHDDLPCMDNDDLRRGRPTCHKAFDEATAVLAGDGLLTAAFETASKADVPAETALRCIRILGENAGMNGMIGGQVLDMLAEHRRISETELRLLQKPQDRLPAARRMRARLCGGRKDRYRDASRPRAPMAISSALPSRSRTISSTSRATRKRSASPSARTRQAKNRPFPSLLGLDACRKLAGELTEQAVAALARRMKDARFWKRSRAA